MADVEIYYDPDGLDSSDGDGDGVVYIDLESHDYDDYDNDVDDIYDEFIPGEADGLDGEDDEFDPYLDNESEFEEEPTVSGYFLRRVIHREETPLPEFKPEPEGLKLMASGSFGRPSLHLTPYHDELRCTTGGTPWARLLREQGTHTAQEINRRLSHKMLPVVTSQMIIYEHPVYAGQFSANGDFFFSASQDFMIRLFDTRDINNWKLYKSYLYPTGRWTLTDATLSADNKFIAYCTLGPNIAIAPTSPLDSGQPRIFTLEEDEDNEWGIRIYSLRFSHQGNEVLLGCSENKVVLYDIVTGQPSCQFRSRADTNTVTYLVPGDDNVFVTGGDDTLVHIWDRRTKRSPVGYLVGHTEGITSVDSKGDGIHLVTNGKDQSTRIWDTRSAYSDLHRAGDIGINNRWDYRFEGSWRLKPEKPGNNSLVTIRNGQRIQRTLIRCHFSPARTGSNQIITGTADGQVFYYNLDGTIARQIDVDADSWRCIEQTIRDMHTRRRLDVCVRDVSVHPFENAMVASSINNILGLEADGNLHGSRGCLSMYVYEKGTAVNSHGNRERWKVVNNDLKPMFSDHHTFGIPLRDPDSQSVIDDTESDQDEN